MERLYTIIGMYAEQNEVLKAQLRAAQEKIQQLQEARANDAEPEKQANDA